MVFGDFNAKVWSSVVNGYTGAFGLGDCNEREDRLIKFSQNKEMYITNTTFKPPKRLLYTWTAPGDGIYGKVIRNQIDYV